MDNATRVERLMMMNDMLKNHSKLFKTVTFDLGIWAEGMEEGKDGSIVAGSCGTAACAVGSACIYKPFNKLGFVLEGTENSEQYPVYGEYTGWSAVRHFFGITYDEANHLFSEDFYESHNPTAKQVAKRVRELVVKYTHAEQQPVQPEASISTDELPF